MNVVLGRLLGKQPLFASSLWIPKFFRLNVRRWNATEASFRSLKYYEVLPDGLKLKKEAVTDNAALNKAYQEYLTLLKFEEDKHQLKCRSCGIAPLQSTDPNAENYYQPSKFVPTVQKKSNHDIPEEAKRELLQHMGIEEGSLIGDSTVICHERNVIKLSNISNYLVCCKRCLDLVDHGVIDIAHYNLADIMKKIPKEAIVVNVMSLVDFPTACDSAVYKDRDPKSIYYFITGGDYFYRIKEQIRNSGEQYVRGVLAKYMDADPEKVFLVSAKKGWYVRESFKKLPPGSVYLVGRSNAGKSSLIKKLIVTQENIKLDKNTAKTEINSERYLASLGINAPGVHLVPGFTRDMQKFDKIPGYTIYDTPGYIQADHGLYKHILPELIRKEREYPQFSAEDHKIYSSFKFKGKAGYDGNVLCSYGGVFFLQPPHGIVFQRANFFPYKTNQTEYRYRNWHRAREANYKRTKANVGKFVLKKESFEDMDRYVIPPFYGTVDIVIQDFGFFSLAPTSSPKDVSGLFQIWVPSNVRVILRDSIFKYLYKRHELYDKTGNVIKKSNIVKKGVSALQKITDDKLHFSELISADPKIENSDAFLLACPKKDIKPPIVGRAQDGRPVYPKYKNPYWRKLKV